MKNFAKQIVMLLVFIFVTFFVSACSEDENGLAPYVGTPDMSNILVEAESFTPKITWLGGYATVLGVNRGTKAALDTSLVWLVSNPGNNLKYPVKFGDLPSGAQDLTSQFGGVALDSLNEDEDYHFWVMKEDAWNQVQSELGKAFAVDSALGEGQIIANQDTVFISSSLFVSFAKRLDVFINIESVSAFGQLGVISISETRSNRPIIDWVISQAGVTDSKISVIGIAEGNQFSSGGTIWEVYSESQENGSTVYGKSNVISGPLNVGDSLASTFSFVPFDQSGLERNKTYYIWIANDLWGGEGRLRFEPGYAYATFNTR